MMEPPRWKIITPSQYEWERRGLDFVRSGLPNHDPYRAWANFEFQTPDGAIYEVDLLVLTKHGFWLVEIKSWPGRIWGDAGTWTRTLDGKTISEDNPVMLANRKAKALISLLKSQQAVKKGRVPWLDAVVFLSADNIQCDLTGPARNHVVLRDRPAGDNRPEQDGILAALLSRRGPGIDPDCRNVIDSTVAKALSRAIEQAGIRLSQRSRRVGDYVLGDLLSDGPGFQDRLAKHASFDDVYCRVRQYTVAQAESEEDRQRRKRAAAREFQIIQSLNHPNILPVLDYREHELGPALLFRYLDPQAMRFDHYLATHCHKLTSEHRLTMLRQIADAIRYAHRKRVIHRALGPQSILVMKDEGGRMKAEMERAKAAMEVKEDNPPFASPFDDPSQLYLQVFNWQVGVRETTTTSGRVTNVEDLVEAQSFVYMSPEAIADQRKVSEASDVFSLGAIAFHLFASRPPAGSPSELAKILREKKGLSLSSVVDGVGPKLEEMIQWCTHPDVNTRVGSVEDFLSLLDDVEDELTAPDESFVSNPLQAKRGDRLEGGFVVEKELGQGATAKALLVTRDEQQFVLKVALTEDDNSRLHDEAKALGTIHSEFIVAIHEELEMAGHTVLVLQKAGDETLAGLLRKEGVPALDLLGRYGDDLLSALASLERHGVNHRDIKPDNIGIRSLTKQRNQLVLFDFSLTGVPLDNLRVGTPGYMDPFLVNRKPQRWDQAAERYSAGVTLYEMSAGLGVLPQWGDDKSDPAMTDAELVIEAEKFDASVREGLVEFFHTALHRDPANRFDNADEMRWAWQQVFKEAEQRKVRTPSGEEVDLSVTLDQVDVKTPIAALGLSTRARNALERANILTVRDLLLIPIVDLHMMRGVGNQTRQEIIRFVAELRDRFPEVKDEGGGMKDEGGGDQTDLPSLELLEQRVMGARNAKKEAEWNIRRALLMPITPPSSTSSFRLPPSAFQWPSQSEVADALSLTRARVGQVLTADRKRWAKDPLLNGLRNDIHEQIQRLGGVLTIAELIELMNLLRPSEGKDEGGRLKDESGNIMVFSSFIPHPSSLQKASAIARAVVETESSLAEPRFQLRRPSRKGVRTQLCEAPEGPFRQLSPDPFSVVGKSVIACTQELAAYAEKLGQVADELAGADPLLPPLRVFQELFDVSQPSLPEGCQPFNNERLLNLAAAMSNSAAVSAKQELYPRGMAAERALRLGIGALTGLGLGENESGFSIDQIRARVESRYPEAEPLPNRPELDALLDPVGLDVRWNPDTLTYHRYDMTSILETLRDRTGHDVPCPGVWVLVATDEQSDMPCLDGTAIPLISPGQKAKVSEPWIDNLHRGRVKNHESHALHE